MDYETIVRAQAIVTDEKLMLATTRLLAEQGFVNATGVTHLESPEPEHLPVAIAEKGEEFLK